MHIFVETKYVSHVNLQNHDDFKKWLKIKMVSSIRNWLFYNNLLTDFVNNQYAVTHGPDHVPVN